MTKEQQFKLRSILSIAALLRITLDWEDYQNTYVIVRKPHDLLMEVLNTSGQWGGLTVLPLLLNKEEMEKETSKHHRGSVFGITIQDYKELCQIKLINSI